MQNKLEFDTPLHKAVQYNDDPSVTLEIGDYMFVYNIYVYNEVKLI